LNPTPTKEAETKKTPETQFVIAYYLLIGKLCRMLGYQINKNSSKPKNNFLSKNHTNVKESHNRRL